MLINEKCYIFRSRYPVDFGENMMEFKYEWYDYGKLWTVNYTGRPSLFIETRRLKRVSNIDNIYFMTKYDTQKNVTLLIYQQLCRLTRHGESLGKFI